MEEAARRDELGGDTPVETEVTTGFGVAQPAGARRRWAMPALIATLVVSLATAGVFATLYLTQDASVDEISERLSDEIPAIEDRAGTVANLLLNYDSTNLDEVASQMLAVATGNFREQYEEALSQGAGLGAALEEASASSRGTILDGPDVYFKSAAEAIALVRVEQTAQSSSNPGGSTIDYVLKITLIDTSDGGWKADRVEVLSTSEV